MRAKRSTEHPDARMTSIYRILIGPPRDCSSVDATALHEWYALIDNHVDAVVRFVDTVYSAIDAPHTASTVSELRKVQLIDSETDRSYACKRACILCAIYMEPDIAAYFTTNEGEPDAHDLISRVLPFLIPCFFDSMCQRPDELISIALVMWLMWPREPLLWESETQLAGYDTYDTHVPSGLEPFEVEATLEPDDANRANGDCSSHRSHSSNNMDDSNMDSDNSDAAHTP